MIKVVICDIHHHSLQTKPPRRTRSALRRYELTICPNGLVTHPLESDQRIRTQHNSLTRRLQGTAAEDARWPAADADSNEEASCCPFSASLSSQDSQSSFRGIMTGRRPVCAIATPCFITSAHSFNAPPRGSSDSCFTYCCVVTH